MKSTPSLLMCHFDRAAIVWLIHLSLVPPEPRGRSSAALNPNEMTLISAAISQISGKKNKKNKCNSVVAESMAGGG